MTRKKIDKKAVIRQDLDWEKKWLQESKKNPSYLTIRFEEPLEPGKIVSVRSNSNKYLGLQQVDKDFLKWSPLLIYEELTLSTCQRLCIVLDIIKGFQGINSHEALAYLTQLHLIYVDIPRVAQGNKSLLFTNGMDQVNEYNQRLEKIKQEGGKLQSLHPAPAMWSIDQVLDYWNMLGGKNAQGLPLREGKPGKTWSYRRIPFAYVSEDVVKRRNEFYASRGENFAPRKVSVLVEPSKKNQLEFIAMALQKGPESGISLQVNVGTETTEESVYPSVTFVEEANVFRHEGDFWKIVFQGRTLPRIKDIKGFHYIAYLLKHPQEKIPSLKLYHDVNGVVTDGSGNIYKKVSRNQLEKEGLQTRNLEFLEGSDAEEVLDSDAVEQYIDKLDYLRICKQDLIDNNNNEMASRIQEEIEAIKDELSKGTYHGKIKKAQRILNSKRTSIRHRITDACNKIEVHDTCLWRYINNNIKTGNVCYYFPDDNNSIIWNF